MTVLDICAAPGGKTMQLAAAGAVVTAVDISKTRMARVSENLKRVKLRADLQVADAFEITGRYDAVLLDAPCSATGTIRRHPDLPYAKDGSEFAALIAQQEAMIDHALTLVKPGGKLVFCTCSLLPDEGEPRNGFRQPTRTTHNRAFCPWAAAGRRQFSVLGQPDRGERYRNLGYRA